MQERSRSPDVALPRAPDDGRGAAGLRAAPGTLARLKAQQVRCPYCDKYLAEHLRGTLIITCRGCKHRVEVTR